MNHKSILIALSLFAASCVLTDDAKTNPSSSGSSSSVKLDGPTSPCPANDTLIDGRDGQTYPTVQIGPSCWMKENLNYSTGPADTITSRPFAMDEYGGKERRLYTWVRAMNLADSCNNHSCKNLIQMRHQGICPAGWHVPSDHEFRMLEFLAGGDTAKATGDYTAGKVLKVKKFGDYTPDNRTDGGTDALGFSATNSGYMHVANLDNIAWIYYNAYRTVGRYFTTLENGADSIISCGVYLGSDNFSRTSRFKAGDLISLRCIKD